MTEPFTRVHALPDHVGETVTVNGWLYNGRGSKSLRFLELRDGSGRKARLRRFLHPIEERRCERPPVVRRSDRLVVPLIAR